MNRDYDKEIITEYEAKLRGVQYRIEEIVNCVDTIGYGRDLPALYKERDRLKTIIERTEKQGVQ
jgi:hypothetical protein